MYTWNLFVLYFWPWTLQKKALSTQNKGHLGSRYVYTPWKINMEPTNQSFRKENDLPNMHDYVSC